jgi:hypothetical protein
MPLNLRDLPATYRAMTNPYQPIEIRRTTTRADAIDAAVAHKTANPSAMVWVEETAWILIDSV